MYLLTTNPDSAKMIESTRRSHQFPIENRYMSSDYNRSIFGLSVEKRTFPVCLYTYISMILLCTLFCFCGRRFPSGHLLPLPTGGVTERLSRSLALPPSCWGRTGLRVPRSSSSFPSLLPSRWVFILRLSACSSFANSWVGLSFNLASVGGCTPFSPAVQRVATRERCCRRLFES